MRRALATCCVLAAACGIDTSSESGPFRCTDGSTTTYEGPMSSLNTSRTLYLIDRFEDRVVYQRNHVLVDEYVLPGPFADPLNARLTNEGGSTLLFGMLRVRKTIHPFPVTSISAEEVL